MGDMGINIVLLDSFLWNYTKKILFVLQNFVEACSMGNAEPLKRGIMVSIIQPIIGVDPNRIKGCALCAPFLVGHEGVNF